MRHLLAGGAGKRGKRQFTGSGVTCNKRQTLPTSVLPAFRPPSRHKARNLDPFRLICHAEAFIEAVKRGFKAGSFERGGFCQPF